MNWKKDFCKGMVLALTGVLLMGAECAAAEQEFSFADVGGWEFMFSSGAGAWFTSLTIHEDGTFEGHYQDSDMGDSGEEYPNGTVYMSDFSGKFTEPEKVDDTTYAFQIDSLTYANEFGEEIKDDFHYVYTTAHGLQDAEKWYLYLPGAALADLPEEYRSWVGYYNLEDAGETELPFYGLYNVAAELGFSSYETVNPAKELAAEISAAEAEAAELETKIESGQLTQLELNETTGELYRVWDDLLNLEWGILKENLDPEAMEQLTAEQLDWITEKEAAAKEAGAEVEGGTAYSMFVNSKAAELTQERVYELAEYLPGASEEE